MNITENGLRLIKKFEGYRAQAYRDSVGVWTIGYGHTSQAGPPRVKPGMVVTRKEAEKLLTRDIEQFAAQIRPLIKVPLADNQFSALLSFAYNVGPTAFARSSVLKAVNAGRFDQVPHRLSLWVNAGGHTLKGLIRRRAAEGELFLSDRKRENDIEPRPHAPMPGKPAYKSTTNLAALLSAIAGLVSALPAALRGTSGAYVFVILGTIIVAACAWIIRERWLKSTTQGV